MRIFTSSRAETRLVQATTATSRARSVRDFATYDQLPWHSSKLSTGFTFTLPPTVHTSLRNYNGTGLFKLSGRGEWKRKIVKRYAISSSTDHNGHDDDHDHDHYHDHDHDEDNDDDDDGNDNGNDEYTTSQEYDESVQRRRRTVCGVLWN